MVPLALARLQQSNFCTSSLLDCRSLRHSKSSVVDGDWLKQKHALAICLPPSSAEAPVLLLLPLLPLPLILLPLPLPLLLPLPQLPLLPLLLLPMMSENYGVH